MRKIAERDYREMVERYRTRAMRLMSEIEAGDDFRVLIERELTMRLKLDAAKPSAAAATAIEPDEASPASASTFASASTSASSSSASTCSACSTVNDDDARFCKKCGEKLSPA